MNRDQILTMDSYMLLSIINMKLRDSFSSLELLCEDYDLETNEINAKLESIGYVYHEDLNRFITQT
jgi:hypothetical protein